MVRILGSEPVQRREPDCFHDLGLDTLLTPVIEAEKWMELGPCFYTPLSSEDQARYRQEIQKDLLRGENLELLDGFSGEICTLAQEESQALQDPLRRDYLLCGHILDRGERYVRCVTALQEKLPELGLASRGLVRWAGELEALVNSPFFRALSEAQRDLRQKFDGLQYLMQIRYGTVRVKKFEGEEDLSEKILSVFQKFREEDQPDYRQELKEEPYADHVEAAVLQCLARIYPGEFQALEEYARKFSRCVDRELLQFCREIRFYIDWLRVVLPMVSWGLPFCFPEFDGERLEVTGLYDPVLGSRIGSQVVANDVFLEPGETLLVVTGANQGGKTTFARALGQLHYLASLGLCVPARSARLRLTDRVLTHFQREEGKFPGSGRLRDELQRLHSLLERATDRSFLVINEIFASTTAKDAVTLGEGMTEEILRRGSRGVVVTFLAELARDQAGVVSMGTEARYRMVRRPPDGLTGAMSLARQHGLTYEQMRRRLGK